MACENSASGPCSRHFTELLRGRNTALRRRPYGRPMAPLVNRIIDAVRPGMNIVGTCVVCHDAIDVADDSVSLSGGGRVHADCATYRMRHRARATRREQRDGHLRYTGD